jgi:uncharacterized protein
MARSGALSISLRMSQTPPDKQKPRDYRMRIAHDGTWYHEDGPIQRLALARLFSTVLRREADGSYWLQTPAERGPIEVEDVPFIAVAVTVSGEGERQRLSFRTNLDDEVMAGPEHPVFMAEDRVTGELAPYIGMERGLSARLARSVYYELVERGETRRNEQGETELGVTSQGCFFPLGTLEEDTLAADR